MAACVEHDASRRFMYGFSVEDCNMRLWYFDRAQILVSSYFDFTTVSPFLARKDTNLIT